MNLIDLQGIRFGRLTVTGSYHQKNRSGMDEIFWTCLCSCGTGRQIAVRGWSLRSGETQSCGCIRMDVLKRPRKVEIVGRQFGRLTVLERVRKVVGSRNVVCYRCVCSCADKTETIVQRSKLTSGNTRSCGCLRREMVFLPRDIAGFNPLLSRYKKSAKDRNLEWALSDDDAWEIFAGKCHYCGCEPKTITSVQGTKAPVEYSYNGIDRKDSSIGYVAGNVVPCCTECNYMKRNMGYEYFLERCRRIAANHQAQQQAIQP